MEELEGIKCRGVIVLPWEELVSMAMDFWEQADVEEALGAEVAEALPELLRLADLEVRIPRLEVVALEKLAARDGKSVPGCTRVQFLPYDGLGGAT